MTTATQPLPSASIETRRPTVGELHEYAKRIAEALVGWKYHEAESTDGDGLPSYSAVIDLGAGMLSLSHICEGKQDRLSVRAYAPWSLSDRSRFHEPYGFVRASATFGWGRPPSTVAKELIRRGVVDNARALLGHYLVAEKSRNESRAAQAAAVATLQAGGLIVHDPRNPDDIEQSFYARGDSQYLHGNVCGGHVRIDRLSVTAEQAVAIAKLLGCTP